MVVQNQVRKDLYFDSVTLMVASSMMRQLEGVDGAAVMMGTEHNRQLLEDSGLLGPDIEPFGVNDTVVAVRAESAQAAQAAIALFDAQMSGGPEPWPRPRPRIPAQIWRLSPCRGGLRGPRRKRRWGRGCTCSCSAITFHWRMR